LRHAFIGEEMRLEKFSTSYKDEDDGPNLALASKVMRGGRKGGPGMGQKGEEEESNSSC
jgi:hypothetical protein